MALMVTVSGIDCAGKTTQIDLLCQHVRKHAESVAVCWYRPGYSRELDALRKLIRWVIPGGLPESRQQERRNRAFARPVVGRTWIIMALADMAFQWGLKLRVLRRLHNVVICDRYLWDAITDLELRFPESIRIIQGFVRLAGPIFPHPDLSILLVLPKEEMLHRMAAKLEPYPDSEDVRNLRYDHYQQLSKMEHLKVLDGHSTPQEIHEQILAKLQRIR